MRINIPINHEQIRTFCLKWHIVELAIFGSVLREDFRPESDVDVLVRFAQDSPYSVLFNHSEMEEELRRVFGRKVDLISKKGVEQSKNARRREEILRTAEVIYAQAA